MVQAIDRLRLIHTEKRKTVYILCSIPLDGIVNLTRSSQPSRTLFLERGQPCRRAKDFSAPNRRATDGRRIAPLLKLTMPGLGPIPFQKRTRPPRRYLLNGKLSSRSVSREDASAPDSADSGCWLGMARGSGRAPNIANLNYG